jgi:glycosyltransferase involved in cell wall biosynthesis
MPKPEIALLLSTFQRPLHLRHALLSIALQRIEHGKIELVVTDDGSTDETADVVCQFARSVDFPVHFTTHPHDGFRLARCRNEGAAASQAPYLLFLDGDCILPPDHVSQHLQHRKPGFVMAGDCCRLEQEPSARVDDEVIRRGEFQLWGSPREEGRLRKLDRASRFYRAIRHPTKPKLVGNNVGIWRVDYERVNGYDENFQGWGCEDDDLRYRLRRAGVKIESILRWTRTFHLWHPSEATAPARWRDGLNVKYLLRKGRLTRCRNGLVKRPLTDLHVRVVGEPAEPQSVARLLAGRIAEPGSEARVERSDPPEVEILFLPGRGKFSGQAQTNVLVALEDSTGAARLARRAHVLVASRQLTTNQNQLQFTLDDFDRALDAVA